MEDRVKESVVRLDLLYRRRQSFEELFLCGPFYDPVRTGAQHQRGHANRGGIGEQPSSSVVEVEQDVHRDLPENERVLFILRGLLRIMREHLRFDVAPDKARADELLLQTQERDGERDI